MCYWVSLFTLKISIHTPTQGVTVFTNCSIVILGISIHTPTQGVTNKVFCFRIPIFYFNPHSHAGSDLAIFSHLFQHTIFQSTLPRRE